MFGSGLEWRKVEADLAAAVAELRGINQSLVVLSRDLPEIAKQLSAIAQELERSARRRDLEGT